MTHIASSTTAAKVQSARDCLRDAMRSAALITTLAAATATSFITPHLIKQPMYDSPRTGEIYIQELLHAHPDHIHNVLGVHKHVFRSLIWELKDYSGLQDTKHVTCEE